MQNFCCLGHIVISIAHCQNNCILIGRGSAVFEHSKIMFTETPFQTQVLRRPPLILREQPRLIDSCLSAPKSVIRPAAPDKVSQTTRTKGQETPIGLSGIDLIPKSLSDPGSPVIIATPFWPEIFSICLNSVCINELRPISSSPPRRSICRNTGYGLTVYLAQSINMIPGVSMAE